MELIFVNDVLPQKIEFNYEELKAEISETVKQYTNLVYTDDQISEAKADRAKLRKFSDVLDQARKQVKADCMAPYTAFEAQIKELQGLIAEPVGMIDKQVKEYEEKLRLDKEKEIKEYYDSIDHPDKLALRLIWNDKWLNATYSMKKVAEDIAAGINKWDTEMSVINRLTHPIPAQMVYAETMDLNRALAESDRQEQIEKARAEAEARRQAEEAVKEEEPLAGNMNPPEPQIPYVPAEEPEPAMWVSFRAYLTPYKARLLKSFFEANAIEFEPIQ